MDVTVSSHAKKRIKKRLGLKSGYEEAAAEALACGVGQADARGRLRNYLTAIALKERYKARVVAWKGLAWVFCGTVLVTVLIMPDRMIRSLKARLRRAL